MTPVRPGYVQKVDEYALPGNPQAIGTLVVELVKLGGVQEILIRVGEPIQVTRYVREGVEEERRIFVSDDIGLDIRSLEEIGEIEMSPNDSRSDLIARMADVLNTRGLVSRVFVCKSKAVTEKWFGESDRISGIPIFEDSTLPDDVIMLCGAAHGMDQVSFGLRLALITE